LKIDLYRFSAPIFYLQPNIIKSPNLDENPALAIMNANPEKEFVTILIDKYDEIEKSCGY
jgi:hypothetical protein